MKKYSCIKQHDITDCGAACLATIAKHYGFSMPVAKIREVAGTDRDGTNIVGLIKAAEHLGFSAKGVKGDQDAFLTPFALPAIAHVVVDNKLLHYVVVHHIGKKTITIADPAEGIRKLSHDEFFEMWTGLLVLLTPTNDFEKGNNTSGIFERFIYLLKPHKKLLLNIFLASVLYTIIGIIGAFYFKFLIDDILTYNLSKSLHVLSIGAIILVVFKIILNLLRSYLLLYLSQKLDIDLLLSYYSHVTKLPMDFFGTRKTGEIVSRFNDATKVRDAISGATLTLMVDVFLVIIGGGILYYQDSYMFGVAFIIAILYFIVVFIFNKIFRKQNREQMEDSAQLTSYLVESLNGMQTVKVYNAEKLVNRNTEYKFIKLLGSIFKLGMTGNYQASLKNILDGVGGIVILWIGASQVLNGRLTVGQLVAFNALLAYFLGPIKNIINLQPTIQTAIVASDRLGEILDLEVEKNEFEDKKMTLNSLKGVIEIVDLSFRYGTRKLVLENIDLTIAPGEKIALVGESGSGKTTLAKLLLNLHKWESGEILIDGHNIKDIKLDILREKISYVSQETFLFSSSIYDNLVLGCPDMTLEKVIEVAKITKAHDFINDLPLRYNTKLEENGANLSGGQRQRLSITRAILKNPDILILDEATSNLDSITEEAIAETIHEYSKDICTIIIAHRLSTIMKCDKIYVMDKGRIVESGVHYDLIKRQGIYYDMWYVQGEGINRNENIIESSIS